MKPRYLTKTRLKLALECPTKLFYDGKTEYANQKLEDPFLLALAEGGFQVGELAKLYFPKGYEIKTLDYEEALEQTNVLLQKKNVTIHEAAFRYNNLYVRADILRKSKNHIDLFEVKAKLFDNSTLFLNINGTISKSWLPYLRDVAFQKYVIESSFPQYSISAFLMMSNKNALCPTDGLNQKFKIVKDEYGRKHVSVSRCLSEDDIKQPILKPINVDKYCDLIYSKSTMGTNGVGFIEYVNLLADHYVRDKKIVSPLSSACASCEYKTNEQESNHGLKSGYHECWKEQLSWNNDDFLESTVLDIWNFRRKDKYIAEGKIKLSRFTKEDISPKSDDRAGISPSERQWLQVKKAQSNDTNYWIDSKNLKKEMNSWVYPLHFIDFETSMVAIPFNKGRRPYEGIAFQFSHHVVLKNGQVEHKGEYLNVEPGVFPNYEFIRKLKCELEKDEGTIFHYAEHEITYLNMIYRQLIEDKEYIPDRDDLCEFICSITQYNDSPWSRPRNVIDMCELVKRYFYDPAMKESNSIKKVLPAILNSSKFLQKKYSFPIYGAVGGIPSLNYKNKIWIEFENGKVLDPYKSLPPMFQDISEKDITLLSDNDKIRDGGAALTAYARMQFEEMTYCERAEISKALLRYCELDTLAMVMIYEAWKDMIYR